MIILCLFLKRPPKSLKGFINDTHNSPFLSHTHTHTQRKKTAVQYAAINNLVTDYFWLPFFSFWAASVRKGRTNANGREEGGDGTSRSRLSWMNRNLNLSINLLRPPVGRCWERLHQGTGQDKRRQEKSSGGIKNQNLLSVSVLPSCHFVQICTHFFFLIPHIRQGDNFPSLDVNSIQSVFAAQQSAHPAKRFSKTCKRFGMRIWITSIFHLWFCNVSLMSLHHHKCFINIIHSQRCYIKNMNHVLPAWAGWENKTQHVVQWAHAQFII